MTIQEIKDRLNIEHPHQYSDTMLIAWVNDVERDISMWLRTFEGIITEESEKHDALTDDVMINEPDVYVEYIISRICLANEEYDRYNNHAALYNERFTEWRERYLRAHMPMDAGGYRNL